MKHSRWMFWAWAVIVYGIENCTNWRQTKPFMCNEIRANFPTIERRDLKQSKPHIKYADFWNGNFAVRSIMCILGNETHTHQLERREYVTLLNLNLNLMLFIVSPSKSVHCHMVVYLELRRRLTVSNALRIWKWQNAN